MKTRRNEIKNIQYDTLYNYHDLPADWRKKVREYCAKWLDEQQSEAKINGDLDERDLDPKVRRSLIRELACDNSWFIEYNYVYDLIILKHYGETFDEPRYVPFDQLDYLDTAENMEDRPVPDVKLCV